MRRRLRLLNLAARCFHTRERMVMLIRLDSLRGRRKKEKKKTKPTTNPTTNPRPSLNAFCIASPHAGGGGVAAPGWQRLYAGETPPALPRVLPGGEGKSVFLAGIGWKTGGWGRRVGKRISPGLGSVFREPDAAACTKAVCIFRETF